MVNFRKSIKFLRTKNNMTQAELAEALDVSKSTISMYENGNREPSLHILCSYADLFKVDVDYLLGHSNSNQITLSIEEITLIDNYRNSNDMQKDMINHILSYDYK